MAGMHKAVTLPSFEESFGQSPVRRLSISSLCTPAPNSTPSHPRHRPLDQRPLPNGVIPPRPRREIHAKTVSFLLQELLNFVHKPLPNDNEFIDAIAKTSYIKDYLEQSYFVKHNVARRHAAIRGSCHHCGSINTPEWRRGPNGRQTLCNACGLRYAKLERKRERGQQPRPHSKEASWKHDGNIGGYDYNSTPG